MRFLGIIITAIFFAACAKSTITPLDFTREIPQKAAVYVSDTRLFADEAMSESLKKEYLEKHFSVWEEDFTPPSAEAMFWGLNAKSGFGESKREIPRNMLESLESAMQIPAYPSRKDKAIMVKTANVRVLPTIKPRFSSIDGYPFDRWQNSLIFAFTPIIVLHEDSTKEWVLIQSSFVSGWVKADEIALLRKDDIDFMRRTINFMLPNKDKIPLHYKGRFVESARVGMLLPSRKGKIYGFYRDTNGYGVRIQLNAKRNDFDIFPLSASEANLANVADSLHNENYGWGGIYGNRDCSAFVRDVLMNIGVWLPRNSKAQVEHGKTAPYSTFIALPSDRDEKLRILREYGKPFRTLLWFKGHIMLYIGEYEGEPMIIHDVWGLSSDGGLQVLGGISITKLKYDDLQSKSLLDKIEAMNVVME